MVWGFQARSSPNHVSKGLVLCQYNYSHFQVAYIVSVHNRSGCGQPRFTPISHFIYQIQDNILMNAVVLYVIQWLVYPMVIVL